jgi:hypothetical protein
MGQARLVIFRSQDGDKDWKPVKPEDVPAFVKDPDTLGRLMDGEMVRHLTEDLGWYMAAKMRESEPAIIIPRARSLKHKPEVLARVQHPHSM